jgi:hypothetical protein
MEKKSNPFVITCDVHCGGTICYKCVQIEDRYNKRYGLGVSKIRDRLLDKALVKHKEQYDHSDVRHNWFD